MRPSIVCSFALVGLVHALPVAAAGPVKVGPAAHPPVLSPGARATPIGPATKNTSASPATKTTTVNGPSPTTPAPTPVEPATAPTAPTPPTTPAPASTRPTLVIPARPSARFDATTRLNALRAASSKSGLPASATAARSARASGYVPVGFRLTIADGQAPTLASVTVDQGLDGRSPIDALALVRSRLGNGGARQNATMVDQTILDLHKAFTVAVNNAFTAGSPSNELITGELANAQISILGVMSAVHPTVLMAKVPGEKVSRLYLPGAGGTYTQITTLPYSVVMKARLQDGASSGVRVSYPHWQQPTLAAEMTTIVEQ